MSKDAHVVGVSQFHPEELSRVKRYETLKPGIANVRMHGARFLRGATGYNICVAFLDTMEDDLDSLWEWNAENPNTQLIAVANTAHFVFGDAMQERAANSSAMRNCTAKEGQKTIGYYSCWLKHYLRATTTGSLIRTIADYVVPYGLSHKQNPYLILAELLPLLVEPMVLRRIKA